MWLIFQDWKLLHISTLLTYNYSYSRGLKEVGQWNHNEFKCADFLLRCLILSKFRSLVNLTTIASKFHSFLSECSRWQFFTQATQLLTISRNMQFLLVNKLFRIINEDALGKNGGFRFWFSPFFVILIE